MTNLRRWQGQISWKWRKTYRATNNAQHKYDECRYQGPQTFTQPTQYNSYFTQWIYLQTARRLLTSLNLTRTVNFYFDRFSRLDQADIRRNHVYDQCLTQSDNSNTLTKIKRNQIRSYHSSHMFKQKGQEWRRMLSPDWLSGDQVSVKLWIELHNASVKLNMNWNSQAATAQQNLVQCPWILNGVLHYTKFNK